MPSGHGQAELPDDALADYAELLTYPAVIDLTQLQGSPDLMSVQGSCVPYSEGTLGGLVSLGEPQTLGRHLDQALEAMRLCV